MTTRTTTNPTHRPRRFSLATALIAALGILVAPLTAPAASAATLDPGAGQSVRVEETHSSLSYSGSWRSMTGGDSGGGIKFLNSTGSVSFSFRGTGVSWISRTTASAGIATVTVDGASTSVDRYTTATAYQVPVFSKKGLTDSVHTVKIAWSGRANSSADDKNLVIDAIDVIRSTDVVGEPSGGSSAPVLDPSGASSLTAQETDPALEYTGSWKSMSGGDSGGSIKYLTSAGSVSFTFVGTSWRWISRKTSSSGIAAVSVDGGPVTKVDRYSSTAQYQVPVYETTDLAEGRHTVTISYTGTKNSQSSDRNLIIDAIVVADDGLAIDTVQLSPLTDGYTVAWNAPFSSRVVSYDVHRSAQDGSDDVVLGTVSDPVRQYRDETVAARGTFTYWISATDDAGRHSRLKETETTSADLLDARASLAAAFACPTPTKTVTNSAQLAAALATPSAGDVIRLADGWYTGKFTLRGAAAASGSIWICGSPNAVLSSGSTSSGTALLINGAKNLHLVGFSVRSSFQGIQVLASTGVQMAGLTVTDIGYEAVHFRSQTTDSLIVGSTIRRTGLVTTKFGEGVYIGTSDRNWCEYNGCNPDRTARIAVVDNTISDTGAEPIEAKEGTLDGNILGNTVLGGSRLSSEVTSMILVSGNGWLAAGNSASGTTTYGYQVITRADGSGNDNTISGNLGLKTTDATVYLHQPSGWSTSGNTLGCSNSGMDRIGNVDCTP
ncbi:hypothetical protein [Rathayibacter iranicus]|uniref:Fibronectin type-III domain-containing protein n=2 Tax=Rathayibacter iranicus TaxID=59737 RepID=A0AAD1AHD8_9MICO|nr:hypothetical protein [Rathayibacter iranicus]AZZ56351.1 hypothetical protein C7V51_11015 [Rathayibacter iranicus]MWV32181.1 hypothetical protein [Rathayibacter iranicus NCPPB 2253 = VKM Ac-1602]PPI45554.1 hypothetical protein C5E09_10000 [Rathayibacter iranicus]PPI59374.1 hypothetical protein C5E08_10925 [Rathayibacter iranicus]PPI70456.1 hypothetical protein C5E01_09970 [Rathayibacter iranicus]